MSKTLTEWVSAPTEMKSTPVAATSRARSKVSPPEASSVARPRGDADRLGHHLGGHVVEQDLLAAGVEQLAELVEVGDLDLDPEVGVGRADRVVGRHDAARGDHMVVLDHGPVGEAHPVVEAAAAAHGVLLQGPPAGQRLAGVEHPRAGALEGVHPGRGRGGHTGEVAGEVEGGALGREQAAGRAGHPHDHVAGPDPGAVGDPVADLDVVAQDGLEDQGRDAEPGDGAGLAGREDALAAGVGGDGGDAGDVLAWARPRRAPGRSRPAPRPGRGRPRRARRAGRSQCAHRRVRGRARGEHQLGLAVVASRRRSGRRTARRHARGSPLASASRGSPRAARPRRPSPC